MKYRHFPIDRIASNDGIVVVQSDVIGKNEINTAVSKNIYYFFFFRTLSKSLPIQRWQKSMKLLE